MSKLSTQARRKLVATVRERYRSASALDKQRILDEFVALTDYHRKHAIRVLGSSTSAQLAAPSRARVYGEAVREALGMLWEAAGCICGKRLKPLLPTLVIALERHGHLTIDPVVRERLLAASAATIDRLLAPRRANAGGRRRRPRARSTARRRTQVRTSGDWKEPDPGHLEIDLVAHSGDKAGNTCLSTLVLTDVASGWTECIALVARERRLVTDALDRLRTAMPFSLRGIDSDHRSEFVNSALVEYCGKHDIQFTRSRPPRKNDQAGMEPKNESVVRRLVGYGRLDGQRAAEGLNRLYTASRLFANFFQPSFKLKEKTRTGARVAKRYHPPETPCARLLACPTIDESMKERLRAVLATLDPLRLLDEIRTVEEHLAGLARADVPHILPRRDADLEKFLRSMATAWKDGEVRAPLRARSKPPRRWRTRKDPLEPVWPRIVTWLESEPDATAKRLLQRIQSETPGAFSDGLLRTMQRRVKEWRRLVARRLVFAASSRMSA